MAAAEQKEKYLACSRRPSPGGSLRLTEPVPAATSPHQGDREKRRHHYVINGRKCFITTARRFVGRRLRHGRRVKGRRPTGRS